MANHLLKTLASMATKDRAVGHKGTRSSSSTKFAPVKRVAVLAESFFPKSTEEAELADQTLRYLQESGRDVLVVTPDMAPVQFGSNHDIHRNAFSLLGVPETRAALPSFSIKHALDHFQPDLIHLFSPAAISAPGMWSGRSQHIPVVANYQTSAQPCDCDSDTPTPKSWLRSIYNGCHLTLVPSNFMRHQLQAQDYERLRVWQRGVDTNRYNPIHRSQAWRAQLLQGQDPDSLLCLYVGDLGTEEHLNLLLDVARLSDVTLAIVGEGEELEYLFAGTGTVFMGRSEALAKTYASADVFVGLSEAQVVQEAMASGLPAVILNQGEMTELVQDGVTGYRCSEDRQAFATTVQSLKYDVDLRDTMARRARQDSEQHSWPRVMAQLEAHYREAVELNKHFN